MSEGVSYLSRLSGGIHERSRTHLIAKPGIGMVEILVSHIIVLTIDLSEFHEYVGFSFFQ